MRIDVEVVFVRLDAEDQFAARGVYPAVEAESDFGSLDDEAGTESFFA